MNRYLVPSYHITSTSSKRPTCMAVDAGVSQVEYPSGQGLNNKRKFLFFFSPLLAATVVYLHSVL